MKQFMFSVGLLLIGGTFITLAQTTKGDRGDSTRIYHLQAVEVSSTRAAEKTPITYATVSKKRLLENNTGIDLPFLLTTTPSVVVTSDAGGGIGYTGIRIRGTDASRINVTANGIPMNDGESHMLFWVNTPDIVASTEDIQIQRGVGTSTNGAGAFGASINLKTQAITAKPYGEISGSYGSYNTHRESVNVGTGLLGGHWGFNLRLSNIGSDGYIDRASTSLKSYFFQAGYYGKNTVLKFLTFAGKEETYHAWNGASREQIRLKGRRYNSCGEIFHYRRNEDGTLAKDGEGNPIQDMVGYYKDQTDNYILSNYHLLFTQRFSNRLTLNLNLHYYKGDGYYEEYKNGEYFVEYGLRPFTPAAPELEPHLVDGKVVASNLVRRKKMDNWFGGGVFSLDYHSPRLQASLGGALNKYDGDHFGRIIWIQNYANQSDLRPDHEYYRNRGQKVDFNIYAKANWLVTDGLYLFGDLQYRHINYKINGINDRWDFDDQQMQPLDVAQKYDFFNPKAGIMYEINSRMSLYGSFGVAHREPARNNFKDAEIDLQPKPERLIDYEIGFNHRGKFFSAGVNFYYMKYKDQLVLTGKVNKIGEPLSDNVADSYRTGIELTAAAQFTPWLRWDVNATFSRNRIKQFTEYLDHYNDNQTPEPQIKRELKNTTISYSPSILFGSLITAEHRNWSITLQSNYVSKQYLTNSASKLSADERLGEYYDAAGNRRKENMTLGAYFVSNLRVGYKFALPYTRSVLLSLTVNNIFNQKYCSNGGAGSYVTDNPDAPNKRDERYNYAWFFPQATTNVIGSVTIRF